GVVNPDGKAEIRAVKVGQPYGRTMIVVTEGLKLGEKVIVEGFQRVREGMEVSSKPFTDASTTQGAQNDSKKNSTSQTVSATAGQKSGESGVRPSG
ncbi:MAG: efflux RND transporter periplasmic adaptor subunit, partial [Verrucomicrobia bacterium]|nr:efflux RND transporter periplasmic adaptor subunit [Verrucomicrobiota bacterium]